MTCRLEVPGNDINMTDIGQLKPSVPSHLEGSKPEGYVTSLFRFIKNCAHIEMSESLQYYNRTLVTGKSSGPRQKRHLVTCFQVPCP